MNSDCANAARKKGFLFFAMFSFYENGAQAREFPTQAQGYRGIGHLSKKCPSPHQENDEGMEKRYTPPLCKQITMPAKTLFS